MDAHANAAAQRQPLWLKLTMAGLGALTLAVLILTAVLLGHGDGDERMGETKLRPPTQQWKPGTASAKERAAAAKRAKPAQAPKPDLTKACGPPIGITRGDVLKHLSDHFELERMSVMEKCPGVQGVAFTRAAMIQILGPKQNISRVSLMLAFTDNNRPELIKIKFRTPVRISTAPQIPHPGSHFYCSVQSTLECLESTFRPA
jgi:hypothetical protein